MCKIDISTSLLPQSMWVCWFVLLRGLPLITLTFTSTWRDGGENSELQHKKWKKEEKDSWSTVINRKSKRKMSSKRVSFHKKLTQDSPVRKSHPRELSSVIKIGAIFCPVMGAPAMFLGKLQFLQPVDHACSSGSSTARMADVPIQKVFQNLKRDLHVNLNLDHATNTQPSAKFNDVPPPHGGRFSFFPSHAAFASDA